MTDAASYDQRIGSLLSLVRGFVFRDRTALVPRVGSFESRLRFSATGNRKNCDSEALENNGKNIMIVINDGFFCCCAKGNEIHENEDQRSAIASDWCEEVNFHCNFLYDLHGIIQVLHFCVTVRSIEQVRGS